MKSNPGQNKRQKGKFLEALQASKKALGDLTRKVGQLFVDALYSRECILQPNDRASSDSVPALNHAEKEKIMPATDNQLIIKKDNCNVYPPEQPPPDQQRS